MPAPSIPARALRRGGVLRLGAAAFSLLALLLPAVGAAADVSFEVSSRETYVGSPIEFRIVVRDAQEADKEPENPQVENGRIDAGPFASPMSSTLIVNGRVSQTLKVTYGWRIRPLAPGRMVITPPAVTVGGQTYSGDPIEVVVMKSDVGDLLFVDIVADRDEVYLGEPLDLRLRIWIKPYRDRRFSLDESDMWTRVDPESSSWGVFRPAVQELASRRRRPAGRDVMHEDGQGNRRSYYLYEIPVTAWPDRAGPFDPGDVEVFVKYPLRLARDMFELRVVDERPVVVAPEPPVVTVKAPPEQGRPPWFTGAVGRFDLEVTAVPTEVAVGDPITITMAVRDLTGGRARLETLQPPPLARVPELTDRFRMPSDPLAGEISGSTKRFTQTLRARSDDVESIPAIPFSYFDPQREAYVTVHSEPIPITVEPAATLPMSDIVGGPDAAALPTELTEVNTGLLANALDVDALLASAPTRPPAWWLVVLAAPPLAFLVTVVAQRRLHRARYDRGWVRQRRARREALRRVSVAGQAARDEQAHLVGDAISGYVADRCNLPAGAVTRIDVVRTLRAGNVASELVEEVEAILAEGEASRYAGGAGGANGDVVSRARRVIDRLERVRLG